MRFWGREILGWGLLLLGLALMLSCLLYIHARQVIEASIVAAVGIFIFRAGVHFLKVAVAARIYLASRQEPAGERRAARARVAEQRPQDTTGARPAPARPASENRA